MDYSKLISVIKLISIDARNILINNQELQHIIKDYCDHNAKSYDTDIDYGISLNEFIKYFSDIKQTNAIVTDGVQSANNHMINCLKQKRPCVNLCTYTANQHRDFLKTVSNYNISICTSCGVITPCIIFSLSKDFNYMDI